jgi:hypothetical protein
VVEWDEWEEESGAVASALSAEVDASGSKQTGDRQQVTGNRKQETSESPSALDAADSGSEIARSRSPVARSPSPVSVDQPSQDTARREGEDSEPARPIIGSPGLGSRGWFLAGLVAGAIALLLLRSILG